MAAAALAAHNLGFDKAQGCIVADPRQDKIFSLYSGLITMNSQDNSSHFLYREVTYFI